MRISGSIFGMVGALSAFPRRLAAREVERQGGVLRRGVTRRTTQVVFGRTLLERAAPVQIEARVDAAVTAGQRLLSEAAFLRLLGLASAPQASAIAASSLLEQSRLGARELILLSLFDAIAEALPELEPAVRRRRIVHMSRFVITALASIEREAATHPERSVTAASATDEIVGLAVALLRAPAPAVGRKR